MLNIVYKNNTYHINDLSDMSGIPSATIRDRLRRGYTIEDAIAPNPTFKSVREFCEVSWYEDWIGISTAQLYNIYWEWCIRNGYSPIQSKGFTRQVMKLYPNLKVVPMKDKDGKYHRMIRVR
jgi:hypothetical protein